MEVPLNQLWDSKVGLVVMEAVNLETSQMRVVGQRYPSISLDCLQVLRCAVICSLARGFFRWKAGLDDCLV